MLVKQCMSITWSASWTLLWISPYATPEKATWIYSADCIWGVPCFIVFRRQKTWSYDHRNPCNELYWNSI